MAGQRGVLLGFVTAAVVAAACPVVKPAAAASPHGSGGALLSQAPCHDLWTRDLSGYPRRRDVIVGTSRDGSLGQTVKARAGDDLVCGGRFGAVLFGGTGDDRLYGRGGDTADTLNGGPGDDLLNPGSGVGPCCADEFSYQGSRSMEDHGGLGEGAGNGSGGRPASGQRRREHSGGHGASRCPPRHRRRRRYTPRSGKRCGARTRRKRPHLQRIRSRHPLRRLGPRQSLCLQRLDFRRSRRRHSAGPIGLLFL